MNIQRSAVLALVCFSGLFSSAQIASKDELEAISTRGRMLYEYDQAAWHATDAVIATNPPKGSVGHYVARRLDGKWQVAFGRLNDAKDAFLIAVLATQGETPEQFTVKRADPVQADTGYYLAAARALESAISAFKSGAAGRTYNASVIPAPNGQWYVYLEPGQTDADGEYFPLGADVRFLVSADGNNLVETRQMHKSLIPKAEVPPGTKVQAGYHTHVLSEIPEDSDVYVVLSRRPSIAEYVGSQTAVYVVNTDGSIRFVEKMKKRK